MEHLLYVLWHDYWKPALVHLGYILLVTVVVLGGAIGAILAVIGSGRLLGE